MNQTEEEMCLEETKTQAKTESFKDGLKSNQITLKLMPSIN